MLQEQLSVEVCARTDAQSRVQRLLQQNTDLLQHISLLVKQIQELELKAAGQLTSSEWKSAVVLPALFLIYNVDFIFFGCPHVFLCFHVFSSANFCHKNYPFLPPSLFPSSLSFFASFLSLRLLFSSISGTQLIIPWQPSQMAAHSVLLSALLSLHLASGSVLPS